MTDKPNQAPAEKHDLQGSGSLRKCFSCGRWFHNEADPDAENEECDGTIQIKDRDIRPEWEKAIRGVLDRHEFVSEGESADTLVEYWWDHQKSPHELEDLAQRYETEELIRAMLIKDQGQPA